MLHKHKLSKQSSVPLMSMERVYLSMGEFADLPHKSLNKVTACFFLLLLLLFLEAKPSRAC